jgi:hypothetical protein
VLARAQQSLAPLETVGTQLRALAQAYRPGPGPGAPAVSAIVRPAGPREQR